MSCLSLRLAGKSKVEIVAGSMCQWRLSNCARALGLTVSCSRNADGCADLFSFYRESRWWNLIS
jgi:hypothetical protein